MIIIMMIIINSKGQMANKSTDLLNITWKKLMEFDKSHYLSH